MPFKNGEVYGAFSPEDLKLLQEAYNLTCEKLNRCPTSHEEKNRLARLVIRVFSQGQRDPAAIASEAIALEKAFSQLSS